MTVSYLPVAQVRSSGSVGSGPAIFLKSTGCQAVLRSFCPVEGDLPRSFEGQAALHLESLEDVHEPCVRVEIDGRTIGYLGCQDALDYRRKLNHQGLGDAPILAPVKIQGGSLGHRGPPFYFFAEIRLHLKLNLPWNVEPLSTAMQGEAGGTQTDRPSDRPLDKAQLCDRSNLAGVSSRSSLLAEKFGRTLGFLAAGLLLFAAYLVSWFF